MKKVYFIALTFVMAFFASTSYATTHDVTITDTAIIPDYFTANAGDTVTWSFSPGNIYQDNTASDTIPFGATPWNSGAEEPGGPSFSYVITIPGNYNYQSTIYYPLAASFTVVPVTHTVLISDYAFTPDTFTASVGDTVIWLAAPGNAYSNNTASTAVGPHAAGWSSGALSAGQTFTYVINAPGSYEYQSTATNNFAGGFRVIGNQTHYVIITDTAFIPSYFTANTGDTVIWVVTSPGVYQNTITDTSVDAIPYYAYYWSSGPMIEGDSFTYVINPNTEGTYNYQSDTTNTFYGTFVVGTGVLTGITPVAAKRASGLVFENPFSDQLKILSGQPGLVTVYDIMGNKVGGSNLELSGYPVKINTVSLASGIYLIVYTINGQLVQTYKGVKVN